MVQSENSFAESLDSLPEKKTFVTEVVEKRMIVMVIKATDISQPQAKQIHDEEVDEVEAEVSSNYLKKTGGSDESAKAPSKS